MNKKSFCVVSHATGDDMMILMSNIKRNKKPQRPYEKTLRHYKRNS